MQAEAWLDRIRTSLASAPVESTDPDVISFFENNYRPGIPCIINLPRWPAMHWDIRTLTGKIGADTLVEVQWGRDKNPRYELESYSLKKSVTFGTFLDEMISGQDNSTYLTAQNTGANRDAFANLWQDVGPLPEFLKPASDTGYFWMGRATTTPLHHDETNNLMCQVIGGKHIRVFPPRDRQWLDPGVGVHSNLGWVTNEMIQSRDLHVTDIWLRPGQALFLPIGWWHCVRSYDVAITIVYTSFIWQNFWGRVVD